MARVDVAYVEVRPDLTLFGERLKAGLDSIRASETVRVDVDMSKAVVASQTMKRLRAKEMAELSNAMQQRIAVAEQIGKEEFRIRSWLAGQNKRLSDEERKEEERKEKYLMGVALRMHQKIASDQTKHIEDMTKKEIAAHAENDRRDLAALEKMQRAEIVAHGINERLDAKSREESEKAAEAHEKYLSGVAIRMNQFVHANKQAIINQETIDREKKEKYLATVAISMHSMAAKWKAKADADAEKVRKKSAKDAQAASKKLNELIKRQATSAAAPYRRIAAAFSGRGPISAGMKILFGSVGLLTEAVGLGFAKTFTVVGQTGAKMFANLAEKASELFGEAAGGGGGVFAKMSKGMAGMAVSAGEMGASIAAAAGPVAAIVALIVALVAGAALATAALGAFQIVLGGLLAVVIPLVAGIAALVAEFTALAAVGVGALGLLPGALLAGVAAFGPLILVMQKFQDLFSKTADKVGPLYEVFERLKNAIFAVISSGLVESLQNLATTVLPKVVDGIVAVASAWNRLFMFAAKFATTAGAIAAMNGLLQLGARFVNAMADAAQRLGPTLLGFVTKSLPVLDGLLNIAIQLADEFGAWVESMLKSGQLQALFAQIGTALGMISLIARQVGPYIVGFLNATLGPATQFLGLLGLIAERWAGFMNSAAGQQLIGQFFTSMNQIVTDLLPLVEQLFMAFLSLGPTFADLNSAAVPALMAIVDLFMQLMDAIAPSVTEFLKNFTASLQEPATQEAIGHLGTALSFLFKELSENQWAISFLINLISGIVVAIGVFIGQIDMLADALKGMLGGLQLIGAQLGALGKPLQWLGEKLGIFATESDRAGKAANDMATNTSNATGRMIGGLNAVATTRSWANIRAAAQDTAQYMVDMANNGIAGNNALIASLSAMGAAAYAAKNEVDIQTFEKAVTRAYTGASGGLYRNNVALSGFKGAGKAAGDAWGSGFSSAVDTSVKTSTTKTTKKKPFLSNMKPMLSSLDAMTLILGKKSYDSGREIARYLAKGITSGSKNIAKAADYIYKHYRGKINAILTSIKKFNSNASKVTAAFTKTQLAQFKKITTAKDMDAFLANVQKGWQQTLDDIIAFKGDITSTLLAKRGMVNYFGFIPTPEEVKQQLDEQLAQVQRFTANIAALQAKGIDPALVKEWILAGPETAGNIVEGLQTATATQITGINNQYKAIGKTADTFAEQQSKIYFGVGQSTMQGLIDGVKSMRTALIAEITKQMSDATKAAKAALKSKSPSRVFDGIGVDTMLGYIQGVNSKSAATVGAINDVYGAVTSLPPPALSTPALARPGYIAPNALAGMGAGEQPVNVKVYLGTREITDIIRVEVDGYDATRARALLTGRR